MISPPDGSAPRTPERDRERGGLSQTKARPRRAHTVQDAMVVLTRSQNVEILRRQRSVVVSGLDDTVALLHAGDDRDDAMVLDPRYRRALAVLRDVDRRLDALHGAGA